METLVASQSPMVLWVNDLGRASQQADDYLSALTQRAGFGAAQRWRQTVVAQLGFDPRSREEMSKAGLCANKGAVLWREPGFLQPLLALPCSDCQKLQTTFEGIVARREGATKLSRSRRSNEQITTLGRPFGQSTAPLAHWTQRANYLVVTSYEGLSAMQAFVARQRHAAADAGAPFKLGAPDLQALPEGTGYLTLVSAPAAASPGAKLGPQTPRTLETSKSRLTASWRLDAQGFAADMWLRDAHLLHELGAADLFGGAPVGPLAGVITPDAWAMWLTRGMRSDDVRQFVQNSPAQLAQMGLSRPGAELLVALYKAIAPALAGPLAVSLHPRADKGLELLIGLLSRPANIGLAVELSLVAELADAKLAAAALNRLPELLESHRLDVTQQTQRLAGRLIQTSALRGLSAPIEWALYDKYLVFSLGTGRLLRTLKTLSGGPSSLAQAEPQSVLGLWHQTPGTLFVLRAETIGHSLEAMTQNQNAANSSAGAAGLGAVISSVADVLVTLGDIAVGIAQGEDDGNKIPPNTEVSTPLGAPLHIRLRQQMH